MQERAVVVVDNELEVVCGQGSFMDHGCTPHSHAALESAADKG